MKFNLNTILHLRHQIIIFILLIMLLIIGMFISRSIINGSIDYDINYISVKIEQGDNLWNLSKEYGNTKVIPTKKYLKKIYDINGLRNDSINIGDCLIFPEIRLKD